MKNSEKGFSARGVLAATVCRHEACVTMLVYLFIKIENIVPLPVLSTGATDVFFPKVCIRLPVFCSCVNSSCELRL